MYLLLFVCKTMWNIFICIRLVKLYYFIQFKLCYLTICLNAIHQCKIGRPAGQAGTYGSARWARCRPISKTERTPGGRPTQMDKRRTKSSSAWVARLELLLCFLIFNIVWHQITRSSKSLCAFLSWFFLFKVLWPHLCNWEWTIAKRAAKFKF